MERIKYRITLNAHEPGIQGTLQGFTTVDTMSRSIVINLKESGSTYKIPDNITAIMYVTTPSATEPSIHECRIEDNAIIYDVAQITEPGITEMRVKLIETSIDGAKGVLLAPSFAVEVAEGEISDEVAIQTPKYTALENAIAKANGVYNERLLRIEIDEFCVFRAYYADGTVYENDHLKDAIFNQTALLCESWAKGGTGVRNGEDTNNSMYFSNVSKSYAIDADQSAEVGKSMADMAKMYSALTLFSIDFENGELKYTSANYSFDINEETGVLTIEGEPYSAEELAKKAIDEWLAAKNTEIDETIRMEVDRAINNLKSAKIGEITLLASKWVGNTSPYYQIVNVDGVTENSQIDLTPSADQLSIFWEKDIAFVTENEDRTVTVYAIGQKPTNDYTIQCTITEVE